MLMISFFPAVTLFLFIVVFRAMITISSSNWIVAWVGIELNILSFLPLITMRGGGGYYAEAAGKYFLAQAAGTCLFLFSPVIWASPYPALGILFIIAGLLLKMGAAPLHQWFPSVVSRLPWSTNLILITWQKIPPLIVILAVVKPQAVRIFFFIGALNLLFGAFGGLAQTQLRPLFAYSSISHMGWILSLIVLSIVGFLSYIGVYIILLTPLILIILFFGSYGVKIIGVLRRLKRVFLFIFRLILLSLGGIPPFSGFFIKIYRLFIIIDEGFIIIRLFFVLCATLRLAYYVNILFLRIICGGLVRLDPCQPKIGMGRALLWGFSLGGLPLLVRVII